MLNEADMMRAIRAALEEDLGPGDITSRVVIDEQLRARARIVARQHLVVAGMPVARAVFREIDSLVRIEQASDDGDERRPGESLALLTGSARSILAGERTALNFLQRMSGIATAARRFVQSASGSGVEIADTRKTVPGLRALDKHAVLTGGGVNHRAGLYDAILIKDNHWRLAGGVGPAVRRARACADLPSGPGGRIEVEVGTLIEVSEALEAGADALLLDNMDPATLEEAIRVAHGRAFLEVSGGVVEADIPRLARLGINRISIGALTHSTRAVDIALEMEPL